MIARTHQRKDEDMLRVLGLGDNVVDKYMHIRTMYPGGNALSFAVYARMFGIEAGYLGVLGDDEATAHVYDTTHDLGLELSHCRSHPGKNGYAGMYLDNGDRVFIGSDKGGVSGEHPLELTVMDGAYIAGYGIVHTSILSYIEDELSLLRRVPSFVFMGSSDRADEEYLRRCASHVDCTSISCGGIPRSEIERQMTLAREFRCRYIVIATGGAKGVLVMVDGRLYERSPCLAEAVGIMEVGDSSITCFLIDYVGAMRDSRDFPAASRTEEAATAADYQDLAIKTSLYHVAVYSVGNYQKNGSFGFGKVFRNE